MRPDVKVQGVHLRSALGLATASVRHNGPTSHLVQFSASLQSFACAYKKMLVNNEDAWQITKFKSVIKRKKDDWDEANKTSEQRHVYYSTPIHFFILK